MKRNNLGFLAAVVLGGLMACSPIARSQDASTPAGTNAPSQSPHHRDPLAMLTKQLDLTQDQQDKIKPILKDQHDQIMAMRKDESLSDDDKRAKRKEIMDSTNTKIKALLTPDQVTKWDAMRTKHAPKPNN